jgi:hypothetical protein
MAVLRPLAELEPVALPDPEENFPELRLEDDGDTDDKARREDVEQPQKSVELEEKSYRVHDENIHGTLQQLYGLRLQKNAVRRVENESENAYVEEGLYGNVQRAKFFNEFHEG